MVFIPIFQLLQTTRTDIIAGDIIKSGGLYYEKVKNIYAH